MGNTPRSNVLTWLTARNVRTDEPDKGLRGVSESEPVAVEETVEPVAETEAEEAAPRRGRASA